MSSCSSGAPGAVEADEPRLVPHELLMRLGVTGRVDAMVRAGSEDGQRTSYDVALGLDGVSASAGAGNCGSIARRQVSMATGGRGSALADGALP